MSNHQFLLRLIRSKGWPVACEKAVSSTGCKGHLLSLERRYLYSPLLRRSPRADKRFKSPCFNTARQGDDRLPTCGHPCPYQK